jgi:excisionase family DNA binding protein
MKSKLITVTEAAQLKGVTRSAIYAAIREGRLPHRQVLGRFAVREVDVVAWIPTPRAGRRKGTKLSEEAKARISQAQKNRWLKQKQQG